MSSLAWSSETAVSHSARRSLYFESLIHPTFVGIHNHDDIVFQISGTKSYSKGVGIQINAIAVGQLPYQ